MHASATHSCERKQDFNEYRLQGAYLANIPSLNVPNLRDKTSRKSCRKFRADFVIVWQIFQLSGRAASALSQCLRIRQTCRQ